jgi:CheY-like chemotaxis protein
MFANLRALIVEDDALSLMSMTALLKSLGIGYKRNTTGAKVMAQAITMQPSFVLLDTGLPDGNPLRIYQRLRHDARTSQLPVILMAEDITPEMLKCVAGHRLTAALKKPFSEADFTRTLKSLLDEKTAVSGPSAPAESTHQSRSSQ